MTNDVFWTAIHEFEGLAKAADKTTLANLIGSGRMTPAYYLLLEAAGTTPAARAEQVKDPAVVDWDAALKNFTAGYIAALIENQGTAEWPLDVWFYPTQDTAVNLYRDDADLKFAALYVNTADGYARAGNKMVQMDDQDIQALFEKLQ